MIANQTNQMMSFEILALDSGLPVPDQSFFSDDCQTQHCSDIRPQTPHSASDDYWIQDFDDIRSYYESLELDLNDEPEFALEAMAKGVGPQDPSKSADILEYLDSTAFLSPLSLGPTSPQTPDGKGLDQPLDDIADEDKWNDTTGMALLEEILSANSTDADEPSDQCFDSELNVQYITEVSKDSKPVDSTGVERKQSSKRQTKRKTETQIPKANKRRKTTVTEKKERKRNQNKSAANRYRMKKRAELDSIDSLQSQYLSANQDLKARLQKLQMEFKVVYPLAKAAFASDYNKTLQLQALDLRVLRDSLLE